jgi:hypothetical protein
LEEAFTFKPPCRVDCCDLAAGIGACHPLKCSIDRRKIGPSRGECGGGVRAPAARPSVVVVESALLRSSTRWTQ